MFDLLSEQNEYRRLHGYFYSLDAKYDEMSITGMRSVKIMMHPPYFKIAKGLLRFSFQELELPISQMFPSEEKQKCEKTCNYQLQYRYLN